MPNTVLESTTSVGPGAPYTSNSVSLLKRTIDFNTITANKAAADTFDVFAIPAGSMVLTAGIEVLVPDTTANSPTLSLGDVAGATQYLNASLNPKAAVGAAASFMAAPFSAAEAYITQTYLRLTINTAAMTNGKISVWMLLISPREVS
jgi:hypothetical protein